MGKISAIILLLLSLSAQSNPDIQITHTLDSMFADIQHISEQSFNDYQNLISTHISPQIDILNMSQLILGRHWKRASIDQKQRFLECFKRQFRATQAQALFDWQPTSWKVLNQEFNTNQSGRCYFADAIE
jgi:ABC-type transporter MlaC component